ncbi:type I DNA topoisomerase [Gottschalkiaceae bacterium SANA]|nr:type I DNA topoisomerase [Gottschalkiaceae bacterium SANA]
MGKSLVIVESPAKAKTIGKFLGKNYKIKASVGHLIDLPKSKLGIDIENEFNPEYITIRGKGKILAELKKEAKKADRVYLATDPDREGEAISWHLARALQLNQDELIRIEFNEVTKTAVKKSIKEPRKIDLDLVDAQQARRVLDRLVGYQISPILWRNVRKGLSAGRVQTVATKIICDREREIDAFVPEAYWVFLGEFHHAPSTITVNAKLEARWNGKKAEKLTITSKEEADQIRQDLKDQKATIFSMKRTHSYRKPQAPYTTSKLQQEASNLIGYSPKKTMQIAQQLYEGIELKGEGTTGLITYMRTDSVRLSDDALQEARTFILEAYGETYYNGEVRYKSKKKDIQDAHEAIRATSAMRSPESIKASLTRDQFRLYSLIWSKYVGSQMVPAKIETAKIEIDVNQYLFRAKESTVIFEGFMALIPQSGFESKLQFDALVPQEPIAVQKIDGEEKFTKPPSRYTEASLVRLLEDLGIGRPSTFAPTISTILGRRYVELEEKKLHPTELGFVTTDLLGEYFGTIFNTDFTANMERQLDVVEQGETPWKTVIKEFYKELEPRLNHANETIQKIEIAERVSDVQCEKCGKLMVIKTGRFGEFLACPGYPECKNTKAILKDTGVSCPKCKEGTIIERRSKKGKKFYGCSAYPACDFVSWDPPYTEPCPTCGGFMTKSRGTIKCTECDYKTKVSKEPKEN